VSRILTPIPSLEVVLLMGAVCHPVGLSYFIGNTLFPRASRTAPSTELVESIVLSTVAIVLVAIVMAPQYFSHLNFPALWFYPAAVLLGPLCIAFEYLINGLYIYLREGAFPKRFKIHSAWARCSDLRHMTLVFFIVAGEELIFRQMMFSMLSGYFGCSFLQILLITSLLYGLNHIFMGFGTTSTKFFTGMIYGSVFYASGSAIIVPIIIHYVQNILLLRPQWIVKDYAVYS
jgi:CAAX amino terminal protease family.